MWHVPGWISELLWTVTAVYSRVSCLGMGVSIAADLRVSHSSGWVHRGQKTCLFSPQGFRLNRMILEELYPRNSTPQRSFICTRTQSRSRRWDPDFKLTVSGVRTGGLGNKGWVYFAYVRDGNSCGQRADWDRQREGLFQLWARQYCHFTCSPYYATLTLLPSTEVCKRVARRSKWKCKKHK